MWGLVVFFSKWLADHRDLHSFPTRRSSDLLVWLTPDLRIKKSFLKCNWTIRKRLPSCIRSEERFSRNAETDLVCRLLLEKKNGTLHDASPRHRPSRPLLLQPPATRLPTHAD